MVVSCIVYGEEAIDILNKNLGSSFCFERSSPNVTTLISRAIANLGCSFRR